ncbi:hypothetical protein C0J52_28010 [Blattella germanica]|nr:hypothetical protein C0J52_28010 [Blattella germanica]
MLHLKAILCALFKLKAFLVVFNIYCFQFQYECLSHIYSFIVVTVLVAVIGIKLLCLYIGCMGNLTEKVRELDDVSPAAVSVATIPVGERKHKAVSNGACCSGNNAVLSSCADLFRIFFCEACFRTSSKLLSQDAVHITIRSYKPVSTFVQKRVTALLSLRTAKHDMNLTAYEDVMSRMQSRFTLTSQAGSLQSQRVKLEHRCGGIECLKIQIYQIISLCEYNMTIDENLNVYSYE